MEIFAGIELIIYFAVFIGAQLYSLVQFSLQSQGKLFCFYEEFKIKNFFF